MGKNQMEDGWEPGKKKKVEVWGLFGSCRVTMLPLPDELVESYMRCVS